MIKHLINQYYGIRKTYISQAHDHLRGVILGRSDTFVYVRVVNGHCVFYQRIIFAQTTTGGGHGTHACSTILAFSGTYRYCTSFIKVLALLRKFRARMLRATLRHSLLQCIQMKRRNTLFAQVCTPIERYRVVMVLIDEHRYSIRKIVMIVKPTKYYSTGGLLKKRSTKSTTIIYQRFRRKV